MVKQLEALLAAGVEQRIYRDVRAVVRYRGEAVFSGGTVDADEKFDLASVTKVMATTALCCRLGVDPELRVGTVFSSAAIADVSIADLLYHRSGLPAWEPFFVLRDTREKLVQAALEVKPVATRGAVALYSDIGFIILGEMLAALYGAPIDVLFKREIAGPMGLRAGYRLVSAPPQERTISTGGVRPREPAPGQEGMWTIASGPSREGDVDDDNAYVMNGVSGHAGIFASADDVATVGQGVLEGFLLSPLGWAADKSVCGSTRTFGFDTPSAASPSCGPRFGPRAIGHLGFTGTSLWVDLDRQLSIALLTNRVIFGRANRQIHTFRPRFHEAVLDVLDL
ncbi:MAG: beta-lactamase family protein [Clostridia bacterium]|nr:beta-lactamase family protein [Deltaproteobacteria bacterium]